MSDEKKVEGVRLEGPVPASWRPELHRDGWLQRGTREWEAPSHEAREAFLERCRRHDERASGALLRLVDRGGGPSRGVEASRTKAWRPVRLRALPIEALSTRKLTEREKGMLRQATERVDRGP